jgi:hypothetical protein
MVSYFLLRIYSGVHQQERVMRGAWMQLGALEREHKGVHMKYNLIVTIVTLVLNVVSLGTGYYLGGEKGLWIGAALAIVIWCLSPFAREKIIDKKETTKIE